MIYFSQLLVMVFFLVSLISRTHRIGFSIIQKNYYVSFYSSILDYIYGDEQARYNVVTAISKMFHSRFSKEEFIRTLNMFNVNFKGELKNRIYDLYLDLRMNEFLHAALDSRRNNRIIWAIKMLSSFNDVSSIPALKRMLEVHNDDIRYEVIIGLIKLNQIDFVLDYLYHSSEPINEYISNKVVSAIKLLNPATKDYGFLLESKNDGVLIMGLNLVNEFVQGKHFDRAKQLLVHPNVKVSYAAIRTVMTLDCINFEKHIVESLKTAPEKNKMEMVNAIRPYFTEDSLPWAKDLLISEPSREVRMAILRMMSGLFSQPETILDLYDEAQRNEVQALFYSITKTDKK
nr:HEAT repeat domain-containing protein [uncultured Acetobacteroides sp.]